MTHLLQPGCNQIFTRSLSVAIQNEIQNIYLLCSAESIPIIPPAIITLADGPYILTFIAQPISFRIRVKHEFTLDRFKTTFIEHLMPVSKPDSDS